MPTRLLTLSSSLLKSSLLLAVLFSLTPFSFAKTVVFWQPGFPTVGSEPVSQQTLEQALAGANAQAAPQFADAAALAKPETLSGATLLVLPYGSAFPVEQFAAIQSFLRNGGNLLIVGGQPFQVPVTATNGANRADRAQDTYSRTLNFRHTYAVPVAADARFTWKQGYALGPEPAVHAKKFFAVEGHLEGLGYMRDREGELVAAPVIVSDHGASRIVALDFDPQPGYWDSSDGRALVRAAAQYAALPPISINVETLFAAIRPNEPPVVTVHLRDARKQPSSLSAELKLTLTSDGKTVDSATIPVQLAGDATLSAPFHKPLAPGFYTLSATLTQGGSFGAFYQNGFWVADESALASGESLASHGDFLTRGGKPFFPVGANYFSTEANGWDFSGPRNADVWEHDFDEMEHHGVNFVRTGVWMHFARFTEPNAGGGANERFLRNIEGFLLSAQRHHIVVNFTFFGMVPRAGDNGWGEPDGQLPNPYLDPGPVGQQKAYIRSVVGRFKNVPFLTYDLINEPSFSNPRVIFRGNMPNGDPVELAAWRAWLRKHYKNISALADAWSVPAGDLKSFDEIPLPASTDLRAERYGNPRLIRAVDYNLFAQDSFSDWVRGMVATIHATGSNQLINVGQDEGSVTDRVLNQFYGGAGVSFTTNHTYWQDDALLWDSIAAKRPGLPNITGETGYQPVWSPDGSWRYDELTGLGILDRKWALGFAAGSSGALMWDWDREPDFGMLRSDGSSKIWENRMRDMGEFAAKAAPHATALKQPEVALVLPQSLQLSVMNNYALEAQKVAVRALYADARSEAYAVGEYQLDLLGSPKLILLPSSYGLTDAAWNTILEHVRKGATLLVTGPFDGDAHLHPTARAKELGLDYTNVPLTTRESIAKFPWGSETITFAGSKTTVLSTAQIAGSAAWQEKQIGAGRILFSPLPLELSDSPDVIGHAYQYALKMAGIQPIYTAGGTAPGILIAPTVFPDSTLYVISSESNQTAVTFTDVRSGAKLSGTVQPGFAAMVLVGADGRTLAAYHWPKTPANRCGKIPECPSLRR